MSYNKLELNKLDAARQKEMASSSVTELVQAVKRPRALSESTNIRPLLIRKSEPGSDQERLDALGKRSIENYMPPPPPRRNSHAGVPTSMQRINELPEKKTKKTSRRRSFMGYVRTYYLHACMQTIYLKSLINFPKLETYIFKTTTFIYLFFFKNIYLTLTRNIVNSLHFKIRCTYILLLCWFR